jgi:hypothetical protein
MPHPAPLPGHLWSFFGCPTSTGFGWLPRAALLEHRSHHPAGQAVEHSFAGPILAGRGEECTLCYWTVAWLNTLTATIVNSKA